MINGIISTGEVCAVLRYDADVRDSRGIYLTEADDSISTATVKAIHATFSSLKIREIEDKLKIMRKLYGRNRLDSLNDMTLGEASSFLSWSKKHPAEFKNAVEELLKGYDGEVYTDIS